MMDDVETTTQEGEQVETVFDVDVAVTLRVRVKAMSVEDARWTAREEADGVATRGIAAADAYPRIMTRNVVVSEVVDALVCHECGESAAWLKDGVYSCQAHGPQTSAERREATRVLQCTCGHWVYMNHHFTNPCSGCDREYDGQGSELAPRIMWDGTDGARSPNYE